MRVTEEFQGGNVGDWEVADAGRVRVAARADSSPRPLWFYFRLEGVESREVTVDLVNADRCLGPRHGWNTVRPVYRLLVPGRPDPPGAA